MPITKSHYNRINLFLTFPSFWITRFLLTCHEFSPFSQSGEGPGNKCCLRQLVVIAIIYLMSKMPITKSRYNRIYLFLTFPSLWVFRFLLTCHEFSTFSQSGEGHWNKRCVIQLTVLSKGMSLGNFNVFSPSIFLHLDMYCLR